MAEDRYCDCVTISGAAVLGRLVALVAICLLSIPGLAFAQQTSPKKRVALVIGIDKYASLQKLDNPVLDAKAFAELLRAHGYNVSDHHDLDRDGFERVLSHFTDKAEGADTAVVFYAGHGMEVIERNDIFNVLAPTDAEINCDTRKAFKVVRLDELFRTIKGVPNQVVIVDACREIAFQTCPVRRGGGAKRGYGFRSYAPEAQSGEAILVAYSTGQKALADDGEPGQHSPFAKELLSQLREHPQSHFLPLMNRMVVNVGKATDFKQNPIHRDRRRYRGDLLGRCCMPRGGRGHRGPAPARACSRRQRRATAWQWAPPGSRPAGSGGPTG